MALITCKELVELITAFLDGALDDDTQRRFLDHVATCQGCGHYVEQFRQVIACLPQVESEDLPEDARNSLLEAFRRSAEGQQTDPEGIEE